MAKVKKSIEERLQRLEDIHEIQNLMGRSRYLGAPGFRDKELPPDVAQKTPGTTTEVAHWGVYEGPEGLARMGKLLEYHHSDPRGMMMQHPITTPVIEVAGDGKTAKGVWISPGLETMPYQGKLRAFWAWVKYGVDFVKEDGEWRIWHNHVYAIMRCPFEKSWVEEPNIDIDVIPDGFKPDKPTTYDHPYSPTGVLESVPWPPLPYETWDPKDTYGPPEEK